MCPVWVGKAVLGETEHRIIEGGLKAVEKVTGDEVNPAVGLLEGKSYPMNLPFKIILGIDQTGILSEGGDGCLEFAKMVLRPFGLPVGFNQPH